MRTDLTDREHLYLFRVARADRLGFAWISDETNVSLASLVERGLVWIENSWLVHLTKDGQWLIRIYGEPDAD